jgi:hypothetical protein
MIKMATTLVSTGALLAIAFTSSPVRAPVVHVTMAAVTVAAHPELQHIWSSEGQIRPAGNPHWCLTRAAHTEDGSLVFLLPCATKNDALQSWFAWRIVPGNVGQITVNSDPQLLIGQQGLLNRQVKTFVFSKPHKPAAQLTVQFLENKNKTWSVTLPHFKELYMTGPAHLKAGKLVVASWAPVMKKVSQQITQEWLFKWQEETN